MSDADLFDQAREVNFTYKAAVADVQLQILDGEWEIDQYGDRPQSCDSDGYRFRMSRATPPEWHLDGTPAEAAERIGAWLDENGWTDITARTYTDGITDIVVEARNPDAHIDRLTVDISPGDNYDIGTIYADSTCQPGDSHTIASAMLPKDSAQATPRALLEHPADPPSFGYNDDGTPRYWPDN
ncbi:hypothetical protein [Microbacterium sp. SA39]|uniref:hypothetical protein n=1 Tax=Microbacterium sp. SA39 TaxID=1263625 RepID=UPI0005FA06FA|nr:hypothetical protein [Microbacterium sp. SA39]